jgi:hypothetical protein
VATQLTIYNGALLHCGERFLASLTENREPRYLLDHVWSNNGVKLCLEAGQWHFAMRTIQIDYDPSFEPGFGYRRAFEKPDDWIATSGLCSDEYFNEPLTQYVDEAGFWYADLDTLYVRHVSNDANYGMDMNKWPETFREYVECHFATKVVRKLTGSAEKEADLIKKCEELLKLAKSKSAMAEPTKFPAQGSWARSRRGSGPSRIDRGNRGSLIG